MVGGLAGRVEVDSGTVTGWEGAGGRGGYQ